MPRFLTTSRLAAMLARYLVSVYRESVHRGYRFDATKICSDRAWGAVGKTDGDLHYARAHLRRKLARQDVEQFCMTLAVIRFELDPLFRIIQGSVREWTKVLDGGGGDL